MLRNEKKENYWKLYIYWWAPTPCTQEGGKINQEPSSSSANVTAWREEYKQSGLERKRKGDGLRGQGGHFSGDMGDMVSC